MQPNANRKRQATRKTVSPEPDTNGESFGEIVDRDRDDEEPDAAQRSSVWAFPPRLEMLMRQPFVHQSDRAHAKQDRNTYDGRRESTVVELSFSCVESRDDQREERSREHDTRREAKQQIARGPGRDAPKKNGDRPDRGQRSGCQASKKAKRYWREGFQLLKSCCEFSQEPG